MQIKNTSVLITGGASGLGAATARAMAARGARVAVLDLNKAEVLKVAAEIKGLAFVGDLTNETLVRAVLRQVEVVHGPPRVLVNCAGINGAERTVGTQGSYPLGSFMRVINANLVGTFNVLRLFADRLVQERPVGKERGVVINTASVAAFDGQIGQVAYSASDGGIVAMTLPAARDLAKSLIRVNTIAPGIFTTPMLTSLPKETLSRGAQVSHPVRSGIPAEYAALAIHIAENPTLNGETIRLDGAIRMAAVLGVNLRNAVDFPGTPYVVGDQT